MSCNPGYVLRVSWEEAGILLRRKKLEKILADQRVDEDLKRKIALVIEARKFAEEVGMVPRGSYSAYSKVDRDVLVWVLSAAPKTSLLPYTWWYPIVGSMPYKGFFEKDDALKAASKLEKTNFDTFVRPSVAYSTLGWFDDPLLSTVVRFDDVALVDTVLHEILHNTVWINNHVDFNESLANFVGSRASAQFFKRLGEDGKEEFEIAENRWFDELLFSKFLESVATELDELYKASEKAPEGETIAKRDDVFLRAKEKWNEKQPLLRSESYTNRAISLNNASVIAFRLYLTKLELFQALYEREGHSLPRFLGVIKELEKKINADNSDPYQSVAESLAQGQAGGLDSSVKPGK